MKLDNVIDNRNMNLGELWENIAELSDHVRYDNLKYVTIYILFQ